MHFDQYAFGRRVKYLRRKRNLTLEQMSSALNISIDHLSRIELGKRGASIDLTLDIANLLDVSVDFLVRGTSRMPPSTKKLIDQIRELLDGFEAMSRKPLSASTRKKRPPVFTPTTRYCVRSWQHWRGTDRRIAGS